MSGEERDEFLQHEITVEEKIDGANLGISFDGGGNLRLQNRGGIVQLPGQGQWKKLEEWLTSRIDTLFEHLEARLILFGEWCYARHSVFYDRLPDWFVGFDLYEKEKGYFFSVERRNELFKTMGIAQTPFVGQGVFTLQKLETLFARSQFGDHLSEGLYLRRDCGEWLAQRAKLVRPAFVQSLEEHWSRLPLAPNRLSASNTVRRATEKNTRYHKGGDATCSARSWREVRKRPRRPAPGALAYFVAATLRDEQPPGRGAAS